MKHFCLHKWTCKRDPVRKTSRSSYLADARIIHPPCHITPLPTPAQTSLSPAPVIPAPFLRFPQPPQSFPLAHRGIAFLASGFPPQHSAPHASPPRCDLPNLSVEPALPPPIRTSPRSGNLFAGTWGCCHSKVQRALVGDWSTQGKPIGDPRRPGGSQGPCN